MKKTLKYNKIYKIDCLKGMKMLNSQSVDVIVTSPPYNIGISYNVYDDKRPRDDYLNWIEKVAYECKRVLKEDGSFFLNVGGTLSDPWISLDIAQRLRNIFKLQNMIHWINSIAIPKEDVGNYPVIKGDIAVGHYKPINSQRYHHDCHEFIYHFTKNGKIPLNKLAIGVTYQDKSNINRWKSAKSDLRDRGNTWFIPYVTISKSRPHPTVFPVKLPEMCIKDHGIDRVELVLDPFMGIGTTAIACIRLGVNFIGFEIDPKYIKVANENVKNEKTIKRKTGKKATISDFVKNDEV